MITIDDIFQKYIPEYISDQSQYKFLTDDN